MKKLILVIAFLVILSGCVGQKTTVKIGDNVSVDYTGSIKNGKVFDTSIESIAKENNLSAEVREYKPLQFTVGKGQVIKGFDEGIIGMKVGESKTLTILPEKGYPKNPQLIQTIPIIQNVPITRTFLKNFEIPVNQFDKIFGLDHKIGDDVKIPDTNINLTIQTITTSNVSVSYDLKVGNEMSSQLPWNETVIKIDDKNITTRSTVKKNDIIQLKGAPWTTTVIDIDSENITMRHNNISDTNVQAGFGPIKVHFNETYITLDQNSEIAGETLIFNVTIKSIESTTQS